MKTIKSILESNNVYSRELEYDLLRYVESSLKLNTWLPICTLYENPDADPLLIYDGRSLYIYGKGDCEVILERDIPVAWLPSEWATKGQPCDWYEVESTCGEFDGFKRKLNFNPTHWFRWPEEPYNKKPTN